MSEGCTAPQPYLQHVALPGALFPAQSHPQLVLQEPVLLQKVRGLLLALLQLWAKRQTFVSKVMASNRGSSTARARRAFLALTGLEHTGTPGLAFHAATFQCTC